jgi:hypothetical protein
MQLLKHVQNLRAGLLEPHAVAVAAALSELSILDVGFASAARRPGASRALDGTKTNLRVRVVAWRLCPPPPCFSPSLCSPHYSPSDLTGPFSLLRSHQVAAVIEVMSMPVCPGAAHAAVGDDVSSTSETLR